MSLISLHHILARKLDVANQGFLQPRRDSTPEILESLSTSVLGPSGLSHRSEKRVSLLRAGKTFQT
jgi:hypothetical protein